MYLWRLRPQNFDVVMMMMMTPMSNANSMRSGVCADGADTICILYSLKGLSLPKWLIAAQVVEAVEKCISSRYKIQMQCATRLFITYTLFHYFRWHFCKSISPALLYISYTWSFLMLDHLTWTFDVFTFGLAQNKPRDLGTRSCRSLICSI